MQAMVEMLYQWMISQPKYKNNIFNRFKLRVRMLVKGCLANFLAKKKTEAPIKCDILLVHPSYKSYKQGRKKKLISMMRDQGLIVEEFIEKKDKEKIFGREFCKINNVPFLFKWEAYHANYILNKYQAKIILTERNGWVLPSFIKKIRQEGSLVIHMSHSVITSQSSRYNYYDYDYYLLYGRSSYDYLRELDNCFGSCRVLYKGPYFFYNNRKYIKNNSAEFNITFLCSGPNYENKLSYIKVCKWMEKLVEEGIVDKLYIKCHPRGDNERWLKIHEKYPSKVNLISNDDFYDCLDDSQYAVMNYTNAIIDMAYYGIPVLVVGETADYFHVSSFSIPWAKNYKGLVRVLTSKSTIIEKDFISYHVESDKDASHALVDFLFEISNKREHALKEIKGVLVGGL